MAKLFGVTCAAKKAPDFLGIDTAGTYHDEISQINWCMSPLFKNNLK